MCCHVILTTVVFGNSFMPILQVRDLLESMHISPSRKEGSGVHSSWAEIPCIISKGQYFSSSPLFPSLVVQSSTPTKSNSLLRVTLKMHVKKNQHSSFHQESLYPCWVFDLLPKAFTSSWNYQDCFSVISWPHGFHL